MKSQHPLLVNMSKEYMAQPGATWKDGVRHFLELCIAVRRQELSSCQSRIRTVFSAI